MAVNVQKPHEMSALIDTQTRPASILCRGARQQGASPFINQGNKMILTKKSD
jgi:hypothetical protein